MSPREKADKAKQLLADPIFDEIFHDIRDLIVGKLESVAVSDVEAQHDLTITLQLLKQIRSQLSRYADDLVLETARARHDSFIERARKKLMP